MVRQRIVGPYVPATGQLARFGVNHDRLPAIAREVAHDIGLGPLCRNPFPNSGHAIRNDDPCMSCATHVLDVTRVAG